MAGLRFLGLLDGDKPKDGLEILAFASDVERKDLLIQLLKDVYGAEFIASLPKATPRQVNEHLTALGTTDATHAKARSFFVNAAKAADLSMLPQVAKQARNKPTVTRKPGTSVKPKTNTPPPPPDDDIGIESDVEKEQDAALAGLHPLLQTLLRDLRRDGATWDTTTRDRWRHMWDQALDYANPAMDNLAGEMKRHRG